MKRSFPDKEQRTEGKFRPPERRCQRDAVSAQAPLKEEEDGWMDVRNKRGRAQSIS
jgi:hypothetical protein